MQVNEPAGVELVVQTGPLRGRAYPLRNSTQRLFLGRHRTCDIVFPTDTQHLMVGRFHAVLDRREQGLFLVNLHANGSFVNLTLVGEDGEVRLSENDTFQLGGDGPQISLRSTNAALTTAAPSGSLAPGNGPSLQVQELLKNFSRHLLSLNDQMEECRGEAVQADDVLNALEVVISQLADLRGALHIRSAT